MILIAGNRTTTDPFENFITSQEDRLMDGDEVFRFMGVNCGAITGYYAGYKDVRPESGFEYDPVQLDWEMESFFHLNETLTYSHNKNLEICTEKWPRMRQTAEDYFQVQRKPDGGSGKLVYGADHIKRIRIYTFGDGADTIHIWHSSNGRT